MVHTNRLLYTSAAIALGLAFYAGALSSTVDNSDFSGYVAEAAQTLP